jgi:hypothetical protein
MNIYLQRWAIPWPLDFHCSYDVMLSTNLHKHSVWQSIETTIPYQCDIVFVICVPFSSHQLSSHFHIMACNYFSKYLPFLLLIFFWDKVSLYTLSRLALKLQLSCLKLQTPEYWYPTQLFLLFFWQYQT